MYNGLRIGVVANTNIKLKKINFKYMEKDDLKQEGNNANTLLGAVTYERLLDDDDKPFDKLEDADYLAEIWYPEKVIVATKDGDKLCKTDRSNAWQPDGAYSYFFYEVKE